MAKIAVMGAGAVGCYYGGMLARAGHDVTLIGRPNHVDAIQRDGLLLDTQTFKQHVRLQASTEPSAVAGATLVLFCVKSTDTESAAAAIRPYLLPGALVLSLQNGVDNAVRLQATLPDQEVAASVVYVATEMPGPGHVKHNGRGELVIAASPNSTEAAALLAAGPLAELAVQRLVASDGSATLAVAIRRAGHPACCVAAPPFQELQGAPA